MTLPCGHDERHIISVPYIGDQWSNFCGKCMAMDRAREYVRDWVDRHGSPPSVSQVELAANVTQEEAREVVE